MGYYNVNLYNYGKHRETTEFVDVLHSNSFVSYQSAYKSQWI